MQPESPYPTFQKQTALQKRNHSPNIIHKNKYVRLQGRPYIHTWQSYVHTPSNFTNGASLALNYKQNVTLTSVSLGCSLG